MSGKIEYGFECSPAQLRKLKSGGAITLKPHQFSDSASMRAAVMPSTSRKIETALRKMKGVRLALKPDETLSMMTEGGRINIGKELKKLGRTIKRGAEKTFSSAKKGIEDTAGVVKRGFNKEIVHSGVGKDIAKSLIRAGTQVVLPAAGTALSMLAGDPTGISGSLIGNELGNRLEGIAERGGYGMVGGSTYKQRQARRFKNTVKKIGRVAKDIGKVALREGARVAGEALSAYTGNPMAGVALERVAVAGGDKLIDTGSITKAGKASKKQAKRVAVEVVDDYIDKNLTGAEKNVAEKALAGKYPSAKDLVYDYGNSKLEEMDTTSVMAGYGIPRRTRNGIFIGKGIANKTPVYDKAHSFIRKSGNGIRGIKASSAVSITSAPNLGLPIQTGSPFQRLHSPANSPFIGSSPQLAGFKTGGSFLPAGVHIGGSFLPA
jgi:hypothetical protein